MDTKTEGLKIGAKFSDFEKLDIRTGEIVDVKDFPEANKPAYKIWVDFGSNFGIKKYLKVIR